MSYCVDCGRELPASAAFCGRCGATVQPPVTGGSSPPTGWVTESLPAPSPTSATPPAAAQVLEPRPTPQPSAPSSLATKRFIHKPAVLIAAAAIVLCVAGGLLYVELTGSSSSSAQSVASTVVADFQQGNFSQKCALALPAQQAPCQSAVSQLSVQHATYKNLALGTVTVNGDLALFEMTGSACVGSGQCISNSDPNVAMSAGQTFEQAYAQALSPSSSAGSSTAFIGALVKQSGKWYVARAG
jgi:zinc-ribbon domain